MAPPSPRKKREENPSSCSTALPVFSLMEHLQELRKRILYALGFFLCAFLVAYWQSDRLFAFFSMPLKKTSFGMPSYFLYTSVTEAFLTYISMSFMASFILSCPFWTYHLWRFLYPGLYTHERFFYGVFFVSVPLLFFLGAFFAYTVICPWAYDFFLGFGGGKNMPFPLVFIPRLGEYLSFMSHLILLFGCSFQIPLLIVFLVKTGIFSLQTFQENRKYVFLIITIISALITPPDIFSPLALMFPAYGLYEITLLWLSYICKEKPLCK